MQKKAFLFRGKCSCVLCSPSKQRRKCRSLLPRCLASPVATLLASQAYQLKCICCLDYYSLMPWLYSFAFFQAMLNLDSSLFLISQASCHLPRSLQPPILQLVILINISLQLAIKPSLTYSTLNRI